VLDLDAGVHFHEVVTIGLDDHLERRHAVELHRFAEGLALGLHAREHLAVVLERVDAALLADLLRGLDVDGELLVGERDLDQLLLVHLHRAVAAAEREAPLAVADQLDLVVARGLDVELDQEVAVRTSRGDLGLGEDIHHRRAHLARLGDDALALAAAAADVLEAQAAALVVLPDLIAADRRFVLEVFDRHQLDELLVAGLQHGLGVLFQALLGLDLGDERVLLHDLLQACKVLHLADQRQRRWVVDARRDRDLDAARELLGLVLRAGAVRDV
jgi:hypothetical protein